MDTNNNLSRTGKNRGILYVLLLCAAGVLLNIAGSKLAGISGLPVYLDTPGTVLAAAIGGYLPGIAVGYITNLVISLSDPMYAYYGSLNVIIAVLAAFYSKRGMFRKPVGILTAILSFTLIGGGLGGLLTVMFNYPSDLWEEYRTTMPGDLLDKAIVVLFAALLLWFIPKAFQDRFGYFRFSSQTKKFGFRSLRSKVVIIMAFAMIVVTVAGTAVCFVLYHSTSFSTMTKLGEGVAKIAAGTIDGDSIGDYLALGEEAPGYAETEAQLYRIKDSSPDIEYLYVYKIMEDGCHVVFDLDTAELEGGSPGDIVEFDESFAPYLPALLAGGRIDPIVSDDTFGWLLTAYEPVVDSKGVTQCYAAADISMYDIEAGEYSLMARVLALFTGFFIFMLFLGIWLADDQIVQPINKMAQSAGDFAYNSESAREESIERMKALDIHTGDEIENLYHALSKTSEDSVSYIAEVQKRGEAISRLQSGLILVLADMVESRDKCTGDHVRKTAAYVRVIVEELRKEGKYTDVLTNEYEYDVVNSAPLHDVGKIQVSDVLLNKPGKLTDDEFLTMQSHTTHGKKIIQRVDDMVGDETGFLREAENLAAYHHEKWNGKGYPNGLKGEEIPLSARIMAVADVFDALVSRRSYKEPFTIEQAFEIIRDGAGSHFDPTVVQAFLNAEEEVRKVAATHMES